MSPNKGAGKRKLWRMVMITSLVAELALVAVALVSLVKGGYKIPWHQYIVFLTFAIWVYICYLKQRHIDISRSVVDEKIKTHALMDNLREGLIILDSENQVIAINAKASEISGLSEVNLLGRSIEPALSDELVDLLGSQHDGSREGTAKGSDIRLQLSVFSLPPDTDGLVCRLAYVAAATAPLEPRDEKPVVGTASAGSGDQLLTAALALGETLAGEGSPDRAAVGRTAVSLYGAAAAVSGSGITGKIENRTLSGSLSRGAVNLSAIIAAAVDEITNAAGAMNVTVDCPDLSGELNVDGDAALIGVAIRQMLSNAVLESEGGSVSVRIAAMGANIGCSVADSGDAVPKEAISGLFESEYTGIQSDGAITRTDGTGYRLSRAIVEAHGGTLVAEPAQAGGLRVVAMLPS